MSTSQGATLSSEETAVAAFGISLALLVYTAAVFMCGRLCCVDNSRNQTHFVAPRRQRRARNVSATELSQPFALSETDSNGSEEVLSPSTSH
jgi:hypothetical protein